MRNIKIAVAHNIQNEQRVFWGTIAAIIISFIFYIYFVMSMAVFALAQQDIARDTTTFQSEIGTLESEYLMLTKNIDLAFATKLGYQEPKIVSFARKPVLVRGDI